MRKNFARFVDIKTSEKLLFDYDTLMSMEIKNKPQLHERFFLIEHFKKFKGDIKKVEAMYKSLYSDGKVPNKEKIKIRTYFKEWQTMNTPHGLKMFFIEKTGLTEQQPAQRDP